MELKTTFNGHEAKFIQQIVQDISLKMHFIYTPIDENLVGMETRVKKVLSSLEINSADVRMIGIKGIGGGGKTTLARAIFDNISIWFEGKSFVENVREGSKRSGLKDLQKKVLKDVLNDQSIDVTTVYDGKNMMKRMMSSRKALVVLDDVDDIEQLEVLAGELTWFKPGSRIIITTRDLQVLAAHGVCFTHDVNLLSYEEAIRLFSRYAFKRDFPNHGYEELSRKVVHYAAGLPLTIKVLGSHLCGRNEREWVDAIERLKTIPEDQTLKRLELSYNGLEKDQKEIFLDVVCILKGEEKEEAIRILKSCGFNAQIGLSLLEQKSLISISNRNGLGFHDHIEDMGWNIVRRLHPNEPSIHSRLWIKEEIEEILVNKSGTEATRSIRLQFMSVNPTVIMNGLTKMKELRLLYVRDGYGKWKENTTSIYLPDTLQSVCWHGYPFRSLINTFKANKLVNLGMCWSNISLPREVRERKVLDKLVYLNLSMSKLETFDLLMAQNLETLDLAYCLDFVELCMPVECPKLKNLNLSFSKVSNLNLGMTPHLEELNLAGCCFLQEIHAPVGCLRKLVYLNLGGCWRFNHFLVDKRNVLPDSLTKLELHARSLDICPLHFNNMPKFIFSCNYVEVLPSSSGNLEKLMSFGLCACTSLESLSASICGLQGLENLTLTGDILEVPKDLCQIQSLEKLSVLSVKIKHLPDTICMLKHLKYLKLESCWHLEQLPKDLGRLECLEEFHLVDCISLRDIPNSICRMKNLKHLNLCLCILVEELPEELGHLECLEVLNIDGAGIGCLPHSIYQLKGLSIIASLEQLEFYGFTSVTKSSEYTYARL